MAGWWSALRLVPWGEVIEATPKVVKAAKGLLNKKPADTTPPPGASTATTAAATQTAAPMPATSPSAPVPEQADTAESATANAATPANAGEQALQLLQTQAQRLSLLERHLAQTQAQQHTLQDEAAQLRNLVQQQETAHRQALELIEQLAQQDAQIVATVSALRTGAQRLLLACIVLGCGLAGLAFWVWRTTGV